MDTHAQGLQTHTGWENSSMGYVYMKAAQSRDMIPCQQGLTLREKVTRLNFKEKSSDDAPSYKYLLLWIVRLVHADPIVMLHVSAAIYWSLLGLCKDFVPLGILSFLGVYFQEFIFRVFC